MERGGEEKKGGEESGKGGKKKEDDRKEKGVLDGKRVESASRRFKYGRRRELELTFPLYFSHKMLNK